MTDKELIKQEIERRIENLSYLIPDVSKIGNLTKEDIAYFAKSEALKSILQFIDSLPEDPVSDDLEEEMIKWHKQHFKGKRDWEKTSGEYLTRESQLDIARHFAEWQKNQDLEDLFKSDMTMPNKFYEKGRFDMKEKMMKEAAEVDVYYSHMFDENGKPFTDVKFIRRNDNVDYGIKAKIIIVKEN